ncbi:DNA translocase FtsK [Leptospira interrogans serovar Canicola]|nr:DNA translocase FtsK [Leptospira interrogans serovar Canicola]
MLKKNLNLRTDYFLFLFFLLCYTVTLQVTGHVSTIPFASQGGFVGQLLSSGLEFVFGSTGKILIHLVFYFYGLILLLNESPLHFIGRILGTAGAKYKEGFKSGFGKRGESLGSLFQSAVEKFQKKESVPPWISTNTNEKNSLNQSYSLSNPHTHSYERNLGNKQPSELQNTLHSTFGKEGKLSDFLSKVDTGPTVTSKNSRIRFQNHGAFSGNFEEQGKVFRFESVSSSLSEKIREEKKFSKKRLLVGRF